MSLRYEIPGRSSTGGLPILGFDEGQIVAGSLIYIEPARDGLTEAPGLGDTFTNYARGSLSSLTGEDMADCDGYMEALGAGVNSRLELTSKGALHGFFNKAAGATYNTESWKLRLPQAAVEHILDNPTHEYYSDTVIRSTHDPIMNSASSGATGIMVGLNNPNASGGAAVFFGITNFSDSDLAYSNNCFLYPAGSYEFALYAGRDIWQPAPVMSHARSARSGGLPGSFVAGSEGAVRWRGPNNSGANVFGGQGFIFHSVYVEDCTISGRSYQEAMAWRQAQVAADFAEGGRYYGETYTDPATYTW